MNNWKWYSVNKKVKIFLDLDGVLVNWSGGLCKLLGVDPLAPEIANILTNDVMIQGGPFGTTEDVDRKVIEAGYDFWMNLELLPWAERLISLCEAYGDVYFLTSPGIFHAGAHAKLDFIFEKFNSRQYILTKHKYCCAGSNHILIDDMRKNICEWADAEGIPFQWPCQWTLMKDLAMLETTFKALEYSLQQLNKK